MLWYLIWGEAGNLRFMPELLCFLFEIARAYVIYRAARAEERAQLSPEVAEKTGLGNGKLKNEAK